MKLYFIAGEASGDLHGSNLLKALKRQYPALTCRAWGGDLLQASGAEVVKHYRDLAFMGFIEVAKNIRTIFRNIRFCQRDILSFKPDALVLIDYPGFNLRIAKWARQQGIPVIYYISPQIWAWHQSRVHAIRRDVDLMMVILPFEAAFYDRFGVKVEYVGHPLLDALQQAATEPEEAFPSNTIALLPGSRRQEVLRILPVMLSVTQFYPAFQFVVAGVKTLPEYLYQKLLESYPNVQIVYDRTYPLLQRARAALVKSGTSTLETALFKVPQVVCYTGSPVSYQIAKRLIKVPYISLVNLVAEAPLVEELIQNDFNTARLKQALDRILDPVQNQLIQEAYTSLRHKLGDGGASDKAAATILEFIRGKQEKEDSITSSS